MKPRKLNSGEGFLPVLFVGPGLFFYTLLTLIPLVLTFGASLTEWEGFRFSDMEFIGLGNYMELVQDEIFIKSLINNIYLIFVCAVFAVLLGFILAVMLEFGLPFSRFIRGVYFIPSVMSMIVIGIIFTLIFSPDLGLINPFLKAIGLEKFAGVWLGDPEKALNIVAAAEVWRTFGFNMFLFIAGLKNVQNEQLESAILDGAGKLKTIWHIVIPSIRNTFIVVSSLAIINALKLFDFIYVMTFGGPNNATQVMTTYLYFQGFSWNNVGYSSAIGIMLVLIIFIFSVAYLKISGGFRSED